MYRTIAVRSPVLCRNRTVDGILFNTQFKSYVTILVLAEYFQDIKLDLNVHDIQTVVRAMARPDSGLEVKNRIWLKINIPNAFLGGLEICLKSFL